MKSTFLAIVSILTICAQPLFGFKTEYKIDSLKEVIHHSADTIRVNALLELSNIYLNISIDSVEYFAQQSIDFSKKLESKKFLAYSILRKAQAQFRRSDYKEAIDNFEMALSIFTRLNRKGDIAQTNMFIGNAYYRMSNYPEAMSHYFTSHALFTELNRELDLSHILNNMGNIYLDGNEYKKAEEHFNRALEIRQRKGSSDDVASTYNNLGNVNLSQKKYKEAKKYYSLTLAIDKKNRNKTGMSASYNNLGIVYKYLDELDTALAYHGQSLKIDEEIGNIRGIAGSLNNMATIYLIQKDCDKAISSASRSLEIARSKKETTIEMDALRNLTNVYEHCGNYELALVNMLKYDLLKDSVFSLNRLQAMQALESEFAYKQQKFEIEQQELIINRQKQLNYALIIGAVLLLMVVILLMNRRYLKQKINLEKQRLVLENKALYLQMNPHFIFNSLGAISSFIAENDRESAIQYLSKFAKLMRNMLENSKQNTIALGKEIESLEQYLLLEKLRFEDKFEYEVTLNNIDKERQIPSMMIQPYVENAVLHGLVPAENKGKLNITMSQNKEQFTCTIQDNGIGRKRSAEISNKNKGHVSSAMDINEKRMALINRSDEMRMNIEVDDLKKEGKMNGTKVVITIYFKKYLSKV